MLVSNRLTPPPSKSHTLRAILFGSLAEAQTRIFNPLLCADSLSMIEACRLFGAKITLEDHCIEITGINGTFSCTQDVIRAGNSGIVLRFCSAIGALCQHPIVITGDHSIRHQRPMKALLGALRQLGVRAVSMRGDDYAPVIIQGPMSSEAPKNITLSGEDSQAVSAMLIAAAFAPHPLTIRVTNPGETPWVELTLDWLQRLHIPYRQNGFTEYHLFGGAHIQGFTYTVPSDFSSMAFLIAAALITQSELILNNVDMQDVQGDKQLISHFQAMGAVIDIHQETQSLHVKRSRALQGISIDINGCIDGISILAVLACFAEGQTHLYNAAISRHKECDRIHCTAIELSKMGANITETPDGLIIKKTPLFGSSLHSHQDHRLAMSLIVASLGASGKSTFSNIECINKSYPHFMNDIERLIKETHGK